MTDHSENNNLSQSGKEEVLYAALKKFGFLFPKTEQEINQFEEVFGSTEIELPSHLADGDFLFEEEVPVVETPKSSGAKVIPIITKPLPVDYYKRTLLAAEIVHELHGEMTLGHVKLQKLIFLSQRTEKMAIPVNFLKQAMGPYDPQMMRSIDKQLALKKWFEFRKDQKFKYQPLPNAGQHKADFEKYFTREKEKIHWLIDTFKKVKTDRVEIIATLFGCWEELLTSSNTITDTNLISHFFAWSADKIKFTEIAVKNELAWMKENKLHP